MFTKQDAINQGYKLDSWGHIHNPGKFEGEHYSILYFYDAYLDGCDTVFELSPEEQKEFEI